MKNRVQIIAQTNPSSSNPPRGFPTDFPSACENGACASQIAGDISHGDNGAPIRTGLSQLRCDARAHASPAPRSRLNSRASNVKSAAETRRFTALPRCDILFGFVCFRGFVVFSDECSICKLCFDY